MVENRYFGGKYGRLNGLSAPKLNNYGHIDEEILCKSFDKCCKA